MTDTPVEHFAVVRNAEEQYSIWWSERALPAGWTATGFEGSRANCLEHIEQVWTDLRPASLRQFMASHASA